jgi:type VI secretion system secreted protein VgrG
MGLDSSSLSGGLSSIQSAVQGALAAIIDQWGTETRLYTLSAPSSERSLPADLMVESFVLHEAVSQPFALYINALVLNAHVELKQLYARPITLHTTLADGSRTRRSGYVMNAESLGADGGFARKGLLVQPWLALLGHTLNSRLWQEKSIIEIVEDVFADHTSIAAWKWDEGVADYVAQGLFARNGGQRSYCVQYRESDLDFVSRLLAEEGICYRIEEDEAAPGGHTVVFFADSAKQPQDQTSASSLGGQGIRFHRSSSQEVQDSILAMAAVRSLGPTATVVQGWDYVANSAITADVPTNHRWGGDEATSLQSWLTSYDPTGDYIFGNQSEAQFTATRLQEAHEARYKTWLGRGTVRTLRAGTWMAITQSTLDPLAAFGLTPDEKEFFITATDAYGVNNLPKDLSDTIVKSLGLAELPQFSMSVDQDHEAVDTQALQRQAAQTGYACQFQALRRNVPWRAVLLDGTGLRPRPRPTALGMQTAIVVGPDGSTAASGADELYTDKLGRVKVKFHWQANPYAPQRANSDHSCWVRVMQRFSGPGMGHQFIPRIGHEVLVGFLNNDIDRPYVHASLYNGRGEAGIPRTPGGQSNAADNSAFAESTDHRPSGQMNLVGSGSGGNSPAWHGAAPGAATEGAEGQNNAAALSGVKSKEFGGQGYNQLVFDDTPNQGRMQLHSSQAQTWLQMGHLLHQADNHRGSFRGLGFELRTDAWGGLRAVRGVMLSTYSLNNGLGQTGEGAGAGDNAAGIALAKQMQQLASTFHQAAGTHQTVGLASAAGSSKSNQSALDDTLAPTAALTKSLSGMVSNTSLPNAVADASDKNTGTGQAKVPHMADPNIALIGKAGIGITAGQDLHLSSNDTTTIASGQDTHFAVGGQARIHTGQAIGILAGAIQPGGEAAGKGLTMIAAQGPIDLQAQAGPAQIAAKGTLELKTASGTLTIAAAKRVVLAVSGGASLTIDENNFSAVCPGKITVQAGQKRMVGPATMSWTMPQMPRSSCKSCLLNAMKQGAPGVLV